VTTDLTPDLAVVGGGVIGCFVAYQAARSHPDWRVMLLERSTIGAGATAWSAGVSFPLGATPRHQQLVRASAAEYAALPGTLTQRFLRPVQMIYVVGRDGLDALRDRVVDVELRDTTSAQRQQVARMIPDIQLAAGEEMVTHDGHGFAVNARQLARALVAEQVEVGLGQHVNIIESQGDGFRLGADGAEWSARRVVVASGPWPVPQVRPAPLLAAPHARRKRVAAVHADLPVGLGDPLVYFVEDDLFVLPMSTGSALVSYYRDEWDVDPATVDGLANEQDLRFGIGALRRRSAPAAAAVTGGQAFCDLYTEARLPVVISDPSIPGLAAIRGGSGSGVRLAPGLAREALGAVEQPHGSHPHAMQAV
jgi:D-arginine dehydrogenase